MTAAAKQETMVLRISMYACFISVLLEFLVAIYSKSQSVLLDSIYDGSEVIMLSITMRLIPLLYKPITEKRPYGYAQIESILVLVKNFMIIAVTIGLVINNFNIIINNGKVIEYGLVAYFQLFSAILSFSVIAVIKRKNKTICSPIITTEINDWKIDAISNIGMCIAFFIPILFSGPFIDSISPYLDQIITIILSFFILPLPIKILLTGFRDLFLFAPEIETMDIIKYETKDIINKNGLENITYDVIRTGRKLWVDIYFKPKNDTISVLRVSRIQKELEIKLSQSFNDIYVELLPDID